MESDRSKVKYQMQNSFWIEFFEFIPSETTLQEEILHAHYLS